MMDRVEITEAVIRDAETTIRAHANRARHQLLQLATDRDRWAELVDLAVDRATSIGVREYGTSTWDKPVADVAHEGDCEIADWIFYLGVQEDLLATTPAAVEARTPRRCATCGDPVGGDGVQVRTYPRPTDYCNNMCAAHGERRLR